MKHLIVAGLCLMSAAAIAEPGKAVANGKPFQLLQEEINATNTRLDEYIEVTDEVLAQFRADFEALELRTSSVEALAAAAVTPEMLDAAIAETVAGYEAAIAAEGDRNDLDSTFFSAYQCPAGSILVGWSADLSYNLALDYVDTNGNPVRYDRDVLQVTGWCRSISVYHSNYYTGQAVSEADDLFSDAFVSVTCPVGFSLATWSIDPFGDIDNVNTTTNSASMRVEAGILYNAISRVSANCTRMVSSLTSP